jgi:hypothetical protein
MNVFKTELTFKDLDGNEVTDTFYFHLSPAELAELEMTTTGGFSDHLQNIVKSKNTSKIFLEFKEMLSKAIGRRSENGRQFVKNQEIQDEFFQSDAYTVLLLDWLAHPEKAVEAIQAILPANLDELVEKMTAEQNDSQPTQPAKDANSSLPAWYTEGRVPTEEELKGASPDLMMEAFRRKSGSENKTPE